MEKIVRAKNVVDAAGAVGGPPSEVRLGGVVGMCNRGIVTCGEKIEDTVWFDRAQYGSIGV